MQCAQCGAEITHPTRGRPRRYCGRSCQARAYRARKDGTVPRRSFVDSGAAAPLDRDLVVRAAIRLADDEGLAAVSMRLVAARLGASTMSLYRHVSGKDDLVTAMVDTVLADHRPPPPGATGWRALLDHEAREEWALYRRHPWSLAALGTTRPPLGRSVLETVDRFLAALPLDHRTALSVYLLVSGYVQGTAMMAVAESEAVRDTGVSARGWWHDRLGRLAGVVGSNRYPWLTELAADPPTPADLEGWFDFGLRRVLDGIAAFLEPDEPREAHDPGAAGSAAADRRR
ncbi:TetR/AcrR family transcriptional regulator [Saccharothrix texasensis]|uniref:TetR family transcriptional regulator n=1 Tax=Saccharothrix texasensis TaxID=103734 RepID=A0A3N1HGJ0_9PSEU|nr:TetR/AcrR family transcriptional regulator [Saccharothrix texasensis]ROP41633.1 TetR family transcriptional regulator [Saccharothrix texasensis]